MEKRRRTLIAIKQGSISFDASFFFYYNPRESVCQNDIQIPVRRKTGTVDYIEKNFILKIIANAPNFLVKFDE